MSAQKLMTEILKNLPLRVYGKPPVISLLKEMGFHVNKKSPFEVKDIHRDSESGELVCTLSPAGKGEFTAALTNLRLEITHPLYRKVKNYQAEVAEALSKQDMEDTRQTQIEREDRGSFRVGSLYKNKG